MRGESFPRTGTTTRQSPFKTRCSRSRPPAHRACLGARQPSDQLRRRFRPRLRYATQPGRSSGKTPDLDTVVGRFLEHCPRYFDSFLRGKNGEFFDRDNSRVLNEVAPHKKRPSLHAASALSPEGRLRALIWRNTAKNFRSIYRRRLEFPASRGPPSLQRVLSSGEIAQTAKTALVAVSYCRELGFVLSTLIIVYNCLGVVGRLFQSCWGPFRPRP